MNRTVILLLLFLGLGGLSGWYLLTREDEQRTLTGWDREFAVENTADIHKIFIVDRKGNRTTLERRTDYWLYNDKWKARPNAIENLLDAVGRLEMKYKPSQAMVEHMIVDLATNGIKVELYDAQESLLKAYYIGGSTVDERGTFIIRKGAEQPYVGHLPGWSGNLRYRFNLNGEDWRDRTVFSYQPEQIELVTIEYPKQKSKSFRLRRRGEGFEVTPFYDITPAKLEPTSQGMVEVFLSGFESLGAEAFENKNPRRDSVIQQLPFSIISVTNRQGETLSASLFPLYPQRALDPETGKVVGPDQVERYFAALSTGDFMLIQHRVFKKVLWAYDFFFKEEILQ